jgi:hypothetical protein
LVPAGGCCAFTVSARQSATKLTFKRRRIQT